MKLITIGLFDGYEANELLLDTLPGDILNLVEEIARKYPDRCAKLLGKSRDDIFNKGYTYYLNTKKVDSCDQKINIGDKIVILSALFGG